VPLDAGQLAREFMDLRRPFPADAPTAAKRQAAAYARYAANALSPAGGSPTTIAAAQAVLEAALNPICLQHDPSAVQAMAAAYTAFWFTPPVVFSGATPGVVTAVAGGPALAAGLLAIGAANALSGASEDQATKAIADVFDLFTRTVVVTHTGPPLVVGPIS